MNRPTLLATLAIALLACGTAAAQTPAAKPADHAAHRSETPPPTAKAPTDHGKGSHGMMGGGMLKGTCPGTLGAEGKVEVTKTAKGVTISITSDDPKVVARVQKRAEAMKLMHEAQAQP